MTDTDQIVTKFYQVFKLLSDRIDIDMTPDDVNHLDPNNVQLFVGGASVILEDDEWEFFNSFLLTEPEDAQQEKEQEELIDALQAAWTMMRDEYFHANMVH